ncbi:Hsp20/alpha crystallin family protein [Thermobifida halotolerans]|uniref:Hsp20/alpha crystallin family protein n=1 Tax=Thermobifida halotolerans TaxID=483545 RepID=A0A399G8G7_9ACTN|nr:Hsp20/alpha crystallin family protein [Thermobifida halotolerans]UOE20992.1 Hsp20/alpha crystallin family protein [Thermobifida halotolerans]
MALPVTRRRERLIPTQWNPFPEFEELYDRMGRLLESTLGEPAASGTMMWTPLADVSEGEDSYIVEVEVPGLAKDDIDIQVSGNELVISGETRQQEREGVRTHRRMRRYGQFEYRTLLPGDIDPEGVQARLDNGVLTVTAPKSDQGKPRRVAISQD